MRGADSLTPWDSVGEGSPADPGGGCRATWPRQPFPSRSWELGRMKGSERGRVTISIKSWQPSCFSPKQLCLFKVLLKAD